MAHHYAEAGETAKAIEFLLLAGDQARTLYAHQEAIAAYQRALTFLKEQGDDERAARTLMKLGLTYHTAFDFQQAQQAYTEGFTLWQRAGEQQSQTLPPAPHALRILTGEPRSLEPASQTYGLPYQVLTHLFSGLVALTPDLDIVPDVARSWEVLAGGRTYIFHLRDDARWNDGAPVTANDFEYAWKRALHPAAVAFDATLLYVIRGARAYRTGQITDPDQVEVRALDALTLIVELEKPTANFLQLLHLCTSFPIPRHVVESYGTAWTDLKHFVSNGPFRLERWQPKQAMVLVRNPLYCGRFTGNVQQIEIPAFRADWAAELAMYEADNLDVLDLEDLPSHVADRARQQHAGEYLSLPNPTIGYLGFDPSQPPFHDVRVRQAFTLAIDRETLVNTAMGSSVVPATGGCIPPGIPGYTAALGLPYEPVRAHQLLTAAGYPDGRGFPIVHATGRLGGDEKLHELLHAQWQANLGVEIVWEEMGGKAFLDKLDKGVRPAMFSSDYTYYPLDPEDFLEWCWRRIGLQFDPFSKLMAQAEQSLEQENRVKLYMQADRSLVEAAAITPLWYGRLHMLVKPWVKKFPIAISGLWFWKDVIITPHS